MGNMRVRWDKKRVASVSLRLGKTRGCFGKETSLSPLDSVYGKYYTLGQESVSPPMET